MSEWRTTTLGEFIALQRGHDLPQRERRPGSVPVVGSGGITGWHDAAIAPGPGITIGRAANLGVPTFVERDFWPLNTTLYVTDFRGNDIRFTYYLLQTLDLTGFNSGSVQPMLNRNYIKNVPLRVPALSEQRAIASVLGALDDKIALNDRIIRTCDALCGAFFQRMLGSSDIRYVKIEEIADINRESVKPNRGGHLRYLDISSVSLGSINWPERMSWEYAPSRARRKASQWDTLWSTVRPGRRSYALILENDPELVVSTGFCVITPRAVGPASLYEVVRRDEFVEYLESMSEGSAYPAVRPERIAQAVVPLPQSSELQKFERHAMKLRRRIRGAEAETRNLARIRHALLPKLISGEIGIRDAEQVAEEVT